MCVQPLARERKGELHMLTTTDVEMEEMTMIQD